MEEEISMYLDDAKDQMNGAVDHLHNELGKIRAGKASPAMLDGLKVDYYGTPTVISQVASVSTPDARSIVIKPWEKNMLAEIEKTIRDSDLGLNPVNDGEVVRLALPPLTEDRRKDLVKQARTEGENAKVSVRNIRKKTNDSLKKLQKDGASEDAVKDAEGEVQKLTDAFVAQVDEILKKKETDIMTV
ncbi:ribosome recycling factor [Limibacter armeniacum]|uniref:ribosome recycling factor n=1 Tax=Limibacter armeniacum TaxID=466084 RepID=UPI002FE55437